MPKGWNGEFKVVYVWEDGSERRCFPTVNGAVEFWAEGVVHNLMHNRDKRFWVGKGKLKEFDRVAFNKKRLALRRKAIKRAKPIFERTMQP